MLTQVLPCFPSMSKWRFTQLHSYTIALLFGLTLTHMIDLRAEGGNRRTEGDWGVNRRVVTKQAYSGCQGWLGMTSSFPKAPGAGTDIRHWKHQQNSPTFYLGAIGPYISGGSVHIDAGLQFDLNQRQLYKDEPSSSVTTGWHIFLRNTSNGTNVNTSYNWLRYWEPNTNKSKLWNTYQTSTAPSLNEAFLSFSVYEYDDPATGDDAATTSAANTICERPGWFSLMCNNLNLAGPQSSYLTGFHKTYWCYDDQPKSETTIAGGGQQFTNSVILSELNGLAVGDDIQFPLPNNVPAEQKRVTAINFSTRVVTLNSNLEHGRSGSVTLLHRTKTTLSADVQTGSTVLHLTNSSGILQDELIRVGAETTRVLHNNRTTNEVTITPALTVNHSIGELVTWIQNAQRAYENHCVAPWHGAVVMDGSLKSSWKVKKVIGITRKSPNTDNEELDNTWLKSTFYCGGVRKVNDALWYPWTSEDVEQLNVNSSTGYDARANVTPPRFSEKDSVYDRRKPSSGKSGKRTNISKTIVEFPNIRISKDGQVLYGGPANVEARTNSEWSQSATEFGYTRYFWETVHINLMRIEDSRGNSIKPKKVTR